VSVWHGAALQKAAIPRQHDPPLLSRQKGNLRVAQRPVVGRVDPEHTQQTRQGPKMPVGHEPRAAGRLRIRELSQLRNVEHAEGGEDGDTLAACQPTRKVSRIAVHQHEPDFRVRNPEALDDVPQGSGLGQGNG